MIPAQGMWEVRALLRNGEQLMVTFLMPVLALIVLIQFKSFDIGTPRTAIALGGCIAMGVIAASFTSQSIMIAFDRRWGVLRMLSTTPLGPRGLLWGKVIAVAVLLVLQVALLTIVAMILGSWQPPGVLALGCAVILLVLGALTFVACGMALGGTMRAEAVLAIANIAFVLVVAAGGVLLPMGDSLGAQVMAYTPWGALGEGMRQALTGTLPLVSIAVMAFWALAIGAFAMRIFRWEA